jgi:hypothetical protein
MFTLQTSFNPLLLKGEGGVKSVSRGDCAMCIARTTGKDVPITFKNSASEQVGKDVTNYEELREPDRKVSSMMSPREKLFNVLV